MKQAKAQAQTQRSEDIKTFSGIITTVQKLVDIELVSVDCHKSEVHLMSICLPTLVSDAKRIQYIRNLSLYYIMRYHDEHKAALNREFNPIKPDYSFKVLEKHTGKHLATYFHNTTIKLN